MLRLRLLIAKFLSNFSQHIDGNGISHTLRIHRQYPNDAFRTAHVVNDPIPATRTSTWSGPTQLSDAAGSGDDWPQFRVVDQGLLQPRVLLIRKVLLHQARKELGLDEAEHQTIIRHCRITSIQHGLLEKI